MKKKILAILLTVAMLISAIGVGAASVSQKQENTADALYYLGLFRGTNTGYELDRELTRLEGITLLVRLLGKENEALSKTYDIPFTDVDDWGVNYVGYAYENGITNGVSATKFDSDEKMTDFMFLTLTLRAIGYKDSGANPEFTWDNPYAVAKKAGLVASTAADAQFIRGEAVLVFWNAMFSNNSKLAEALMKAKVFTDDMLKDAVQISMTGYLPVKPVIPTPSNPTNPETNAPETNEFETNSPETNAPETNAPETNAPETNAPETNAPETNAPETNAPETNAPETNAPETNAPETNAPETNAPETNAPETNAPETNEFETNSPETNAPETNAPETNPPKPTTPPASSDEVTYEVYINMTGAEQQAFFMTFDDPVEFFEWLDAAKAEYEAQNPSIEIGSGGNIDLGDIIN